MRVRCLTLAGLATLGLSVAPVSAELRSLDQDRWYAALGGYWVFDSSTKVSLADADLPLVSARVDLTKDLDVDKTYAGPRLDGYWRFRPKHRAEFTYYSVNRSGDNIIERTITIDDPDGSQVVFDTGNAVATSFDIDLYRASYLYSFYRSPQVELALGAGVYALDLDLLLEGEATVDGTSTGFVSESAKGLAPLPVISFRLDYSPADKWTIRGAADQFFINTDDFSGAFNDFRILVEHQTFKHVGFGIGYDRLQLDVEIDGTDFLGELENYWAGVLAYATVRY